jgi:type VI secretion system lysozyme-like protein
MADAFLAPILYRVHYGTRFCTADEVIESVRENVECILNSRLSIPDQYVLRTTDERGLEFLDNSLINFGVADFQSLNMGDPDMEKRFCHSVKLGIERFEPRLGSIKVAMSPSQEDRLISVQVNGQLIVQPFEDIRFHSGLDADLQKFVVS